MVLLVILFLHCLFVVVAVSVGRFGCARLWIAVWVVFDLLRYWFADCWL